MKTNKSPGRVSDPKEKSLPMMMIIKAPINPKKIPMIFLRVTLSLMRNAATKSTNMGVDVIRIEALIGLVMLKPLKNINWLIAIPKRAHRASLGRSFLSTFSLLVKAWKSQKSSTAPIQRSTIKPKGFTYSGITSLAMV